MSQSLQTLDYIIFLVYFVIVAGYGYWIYQRKKSAQMSTTDFFLAEGSLTWWAIGASLIASNISAEQFIGMSGSGFKMGLAIASYEWMAAATLLVVAIFFLPIYLKNKIFTMPQFLERRYNSTVSLVMAVFWLLLYVVVNLTSILYLGAIAVREISGLNLFFCMGLLGLFAVFITLGGMKVIGYTDVIQVFFLVLGGLATTYIAFNLVAEQFGQSGTIAGFNLTMDARFLWMRQKRLQGSHFANTEQSNQMNELALRGQLDPCMSRAFTYAGAKGLISSLWTINEAATANLFQRLYEQLRAGDSKPAAFRRAKLGYLDDATIPAFQKSPYYWAGLVYLGEEGSIQFSKCRGFSGWIWPGLLLLLVFVWLKRKTLFG